MSSWTRRRRGEVGSAIGRCGSSGEDAVGGIGIRAVVRRQFRVSSLHDPEGQGSRESTRETLTLGWDGDGGEGVKERIGTGNSGVQGRGLRNGDSE